MNIVRLCLCLTDDTDKFIFHFLNQITDLLNLVFLLVADLRSDHFLLDKLLHRFHRGKALSNADRSHYGHHDQHNKSQSNHDDHISCNLFCDDSLIFRNTERPAGCIHTCGAYKFHPSVVISQFRHVAYIGIQCIRKDCISLFFREKIFILMRHDRTVCIQKKALQILIRTHFFHLIGQRLQCDIR